MTPAASLRQMKDLIALKRADGSILGFHARNLQVARLSEEAWQAFATPELDLETTQALIDWDDSVNPSLRKERKENGIRSLTVNVTQICNLHCRYCAAGGDGTYGDPVKRIVVEDTLPVLGGFISKVPRGEKFQLTFLGGEPLLYPEGIRLLADEALRLAREAGVQLNFTIVTNGTLFTASNIELLKTYGMDITVSVDGPAAVNDSRRPSKAGRGTTAQIEAGLARLLAHKESLGSVMLSGVFGRGNLDLVQAYLFYRQFNVDWFDFTYDHHETSGEINAQFIDQLEKVAALAFETEGEKGLRRIHTFDRFFKHLDQQQQIENYCGAGKSFLMMDARQNLYTCPWVVGEAKEVVGHGGQIWDDRLKPYEDALIEKNGCGSCWARFLCGGGCMYIHRQVTGDKHRVDTNYCHRTRALIVLTLSYYEQVRGYEKGS